MNKMEILNKQRYHFALSSFCRMYGHKFIQRHDVKQFCLGWSTKDINAPLSGLDEVDQYFYFEYKNWKGI